MAKVKFSVYADEDIKKKLEKQAIEEERSLAYVTARALRFYFDNVDKKIIEDEETIDNKDGIFINKDFNPNEVEEF
jgi:predicted transcriptional regulator